MPDYAGGGYGDKLSRDLLKNGFLADGAGGVHCATDRGVTTSAFQVRHQRVFIATTLAVLLTALVIVFVAGS